MKIKYLVSLITLLFHLSTVLSQDGSLDPTFDSDGKVVMDINNSNDVMKSIVTQPDGKIIVAGYTSDLGIDRFCVVRFNTDGSIDNSFGVNGVVTTAFPYTSVGSDAILQNDGKIVLAGHTWDGTRNVFALARYNNDGSLDTSFGNSGSVSTSFLNSAVARTVNVQNDGKIIVAGHVSNGPDDFALARYNTDGTLDSNFGIDGKVTTSIGAVSMDWINSIAIQDDGRILAGGFSDSQIALTRYTPTGFLDSTFGIDGIVTTAVSEANQSLLSSITIDPDGSIFGGGFSNDGNNDFTVVKYDSVGELDSSFGDSGILVLSISKENDGISDILIQPDNKLLVAGSSKEDTVWQFALARLDSNGSLDPTFGIDGVVKTKVDQGFNNLEAITLQSDGKVLATGITHLFPYDFTIVRYTNSLVSSTELNEPFDEISFYPNPTCDLLYINLESIPSTSISITLFDNQARLLYQRRLNKTQPNFKHLLAVEQYPPGMYFVRISTTEEHQTFKIIKK